MHRIERGAKLVISIHIDTSCILQMPRGNLESIHPRTWIDQLKKDQLLKKLEVLKSIVDMPKLYLANYFQELRNKVDIK